MGNLTERYLQSGSGPFQFSKAYSMIFDTNSSLKLITKLIVLSSLLFFLNAIVMGLCYGCFCMTMIKRQEDAAALRRDIIRDWYLPTSTCCKPSPQKVEEMEKLTANIFATDCRRNAQILQPRDSHGNINYIQGQKPPGSFVKIDKIGTYIVHSTAKLYNNATHEDHVLKIGMASAEQAFIITDQRDKKQFYFSHLYSIIRLNPADLVYFPNCSSILTLYRL